MAGGGVAVNPAGGKQHPGKMTFFVFITCVVASFGGLIFGYDIGISGGVTSMDSFLKDFFPSVYRKQQSHVDINPYCKFESQLLTMFTSSLYLAALIASFFAATATRVFGRKWSMFCGGLTFLIGGIINGAAQNVAMLIIGRILLGIGVGFANQSVPVYLSEMAPARLRGRLNIFFQLMCTIGIVVANLINYGTSKIEGGWGWRVGLGLAVVPALVITIGSLCLPDTPNSLIERGHEQEAKAMLQRIRGIENVDAEYEDLVAASVESKSVEHPWSNILMRKNRAQLTMAILIPFFQQFTGMNVIMFYAPVLFKTIGFGQNAALMSSVITGLINVFATFVSIYFVDKAGRRKLFLQAGTQMFISDIVVGSLIWYKFGSSGDAVIPKSYAALVVVFICIYVAGFAWSWGPLGWLIPSEIFPLEIRSAGQSINVSVNMLFTFVIAQAFLAMMCHMKFGLFYFFAVLIAIMTLFIYFFLPETKGVPIEEMVHVWKAHWFWGKFIADDEIHVGRTNIEMGSTRNIA